MAKKHRVSLIMDVDNHVSSAQEEHAQKMKEQLQEKNAQKYAKDPKMERARLEALKKRQKSLDHHKQFVAHHEPKKGFNWKKLFFWAVILVGIYVAWNLYDVPGFFLELMQKNPTVWAIFQAIMVEVESRSLLGLLYASFFGGLFFLSLPVEVIFVYYLGLNYYIVQLLVVVLLGNMLAMIINYGIGWLIGERVIQFFMKQNYVKFSRKIERAGALLILIGNILPFPIEPLTVVIGAVKYNFKKFLFYTLLGKAIKFALLIFGYAYFVQYAGPYLDTMSTEWFIETIQEIFVFWN